mmetsp:Transcript_94362/g.250630  ORF Transcript_94362/g.250630 Transcript_94362/m.250630 type:complete len:218 (-) Transcript_94362:485-1138(-)
MAADPHRLCGHVAGHALEARQELNARLLQRVRHGDSLAGSACEGGAAAADTTLGPDRRKPHASASAYHLHKVVHRVVPHPVVPNSGVHGTADAVAVHLSPPLPTVLRGRRRLLLRYGTEAAREEPGHAPEVHPPGEVYQERQKGKGDRGLRYCHYVWRPVHHNEDQPEVGEQREDCRDHKNRHLLHSATRSVWDREHADSDNDEEVESRRADNGRWP